jgi:hypothetical protein
MDVEDLISTDFRSPISSFQVMTEFLSSLLAAGGMMQEGISTLNRLEWAGGRDIPSCKRKWNGEIEEVPRNGGMIQGWIFSWERFEDEVSF